MIQSVSLGHSVYKRVQTLLIGGNFFIVLHEAVEPEVGPVVCVRHFLQASQGGVGSHTVQLVQAAGEPAYRRAPSVPQAAGHGRNAAVLDHRDLVSFHGQAVGERRGVLVPEAGWVAVAQPRRHILLEDLRELDGVCTQEGHGAVYREPAATSGWGTVPHVCAHVNLYTE